MFKLENLKVTNLSYAEYLNREWADFTLSLVDPDCNSKFITDRVGRTEIETPCDFFVNHKILKIKDTENISIPNAPTIVQINEILDWQNGIPDTANLLVHCHAGISRSTAAMLGIMTARNHDIDEAIEFVSIMRPMMWPNILMIKYFDALLNKNGQLLNKVKTWKNNYPGLASLMQQGDAY